MPPCIQFATKRHSNTFLASICIVINPAFEFTTVKSKQKDLSNSFGILDFQRTTSSTGIVPWIVPSFDIFISNCLNLDLSYRDDHYYVAGFDYDQIQSSLQNLRRSETEIKILKLRISK